MSYENENEERAVEIIDGTRALEAIEHANVDVQISTAQKYPKHSTALEIKRFQNEALALATIDEATAASCLYALPRAGKTIEGRSVRLAEILVAAYGNIRSAKRIIDIGETHVVAQGVCHDVERNVAQSAEVRRRITTKDGRRFNDDMITTTCNAAASIAWRNAVLSVIPAALSQSVYEAAKIKAIGGAATLAMRRVKALSRFALMGITEERILATLGRATTDDIAQDDLATLLGAFNAIKEGASPDDLFPPLVDETKGANGLMARLNSKDDSKEDTQPATIPPEPVDRTKDVEIANAAFDTRMALMKDVEIANAAFNAGVDNASLDYIIEDFDGDRDLILRELIARAAERAEDVPEKEPTQ